jgi:hypothetical protein
MGRSQTRLFPGRDIHAIYNEAMQNHSIENGNLDARFLRFSFPSKKLTLRWIFPDIINHIQ